MNRFTLICIRIVVCLAFFLIYPAVAYAQDADPGSAPENSVNVQAWMIITAFALPVVTSFIVQSEWSQKAQALVAFVVSAIVTLLQMWIYGQLDNIIDPVQTVLLVLAATIGFYKGFWKPTGVAPAIERNTNIKSLTGGN